MTAISFDSWFLCFLLLAYLPRGIAPHLWEGLLLN